MTKTPDCFCPDEMKECRWELYGTIGYRNMDDPDGFKCEAPLTIQGIAQPLAQVMYQGSVDAVNKRNLDVYIAWLEATCGDDRMNEVVSAMRKVAIRED